MPVSTHFARAVAVMLSLAVPATALADSSQPSPAIRRGAMFFNRGDDAKAEHELSQVLEGQPTLADAARAHVYLGLLRLNAVDTSGASMEFDAALAADLMVELPLEASPKAEALFRKVKERAFANRAPASRVAKTAAQEEAPSHVLSFTLGGLAAVGAIAGVVFTGLSAATLSSARTNADVGGSRNDAQTSATEQDIGNWALVSASGALLLGAAVFFYESTAGRAAAPDAASAAATAMTRGFAF